MRASWCAARHTAGLALGLLACRPDPPPITDVGVPIGSVGAALSAYGTAGFIAGAPGTVADDRVVGGAELLLADGTPIARWQGAADSTRLGDVVGHCADANGDGTDEIAVGEAGAFPTNRVWLFDAALRGTLSPDDAWAAIRVDRDAADPLAFGCAPPGHATAHAVGDGYGSGVTWLLTGTLTAGEHVASGVASAEIRGGADTPTGHAVLARDLDGDDAVDLVTSHPDASGADRLSGAAFLFAGPLPGGAIDVTSADATVIGDVAGTQLGWDLAAADADGDGGDDVLVSINGEGEASPPGFVVLLGGEIGTLRPEDAVARVTVAPGDGEVGVSLGHAGDIDGDGHDDVVAGFPVASGEHAAAGLVCVAYGPFAGRVDLAREGDCFVGEGTSDELGVEVAGGADVTGDGVPDVLAYAARFGDGRLYLLSGASITAD